MLIINDEESFPYIFSCVHIILVDMVAVMDYSRNNNKGGE